MTTARRISPTGKAACCQHPERQRFELPLAAGASIRSISRKFKLDPYCLTRHWRGHVSEQRRAALAIGPVEVQALKARVAEEAESVIDHFRAVRSGLYDLYHSALEAGDRNGGALLAGRLTEINNAIGRITGQLSQSPLIQQNTTNIFVSPEFARMQAALVRALAAHPAARADVIRVFRELEAGAPPVTTGRTLEHDRAAG